MMGGMELTLDVFSLIMIVENVIGLLLSFGTALFFIKRIKAKKLHADILVFVISFLLGCFFLLNTYTYSWTLPAFIYTPLVHITNAPILGYFGMILTLVIPGLIIIIIGFLLKTAFRPMAESATALTYLITIWSGVAIGAILITFNTLSIQWISGYVLVYDGLAFILLFSPVLLLATIWSFYEFMNAARYLRKRLKEADRKSPDLLRLNLLLIASLSFPLVLLLPLLPDLAFFSIIAQRLVYMLVVPIFGLAWALGWIMPQFLRKSAS
ncbi:MAG: hypothetical protein ACFE9R_07010 [Candidatus Hermodarchaeota archaeon]